MTRSLDLGCGPSPKNFFNADEVFGVDVRPDLGERILAADLVVDPIPFDSAFFDYVTAHDFIEHIPRLIYAPQRRNSFVELMNEIFRVLKTGGKFLSVTPAFPHAAAFMDPTHVNIITEHTFTHYFDNERTWGKIYGFNGRFLIREQQWAGMHLVSLMEKCN